MSTMEDREQESKLQCNDNLCIVSKHASVIVDGMIT